MSEPEAGDGTDLDRKSFLSVTWPQFLKAFGIALVWYVLAYCSVLFLSLSILYGLGVVQVGWVILCSCRAVKWNRLGATKVNAPDWVKEDFAFSLGGVVFSVLVVCLFLMTPFR